MKIQKLFFLLLLAGFACKTTNNNVSNAITTYFNSDFTIAFGSCNKQWKENVLWTEILKNKPDIWVWGGDIIYSDTNDMDILKESYAEQKQNASYLDFSSKVEIMGTWDDHDYGVNDGGTEYPEKIASQQLFLDFLEVPKDSPR